MYSRLCKPSKSQSFFLFGPRGSGKSTLLKSLDFLKGATWINLLDQREEFQLQANPDSLIDRWESRKTKWIVIDEVQKIPRILDVVHRGIEDHKIKFALTGSSARKLRRGGANLLANRSASYSLAPFSSFELGEKFNLQQALSTGLLPRFWSELTEESDRARALYSYVQTYLKEEVAAEQLVRQLDPFRRFLICAAQSNARIVNFAAIERDAGVRHSQAERHFEVLVDTLLGRFLEPYETSIRKRQTKKSKFYFFDTGVVRALTDVADRPLTPSTFEYGELFETFLVNEFFKLAESLEKRWKFSYLKTKDEVEIDLIIERPRAKTILVEIKSSNEPLAAKKLASFHTIAKNFGSAEKYVLSNAKQARKVDGVEYLHWREGLARIFTMEDAMEE